MSKSTSTRCKAIERADYTNRRTTNRKLPVIKQTVPEVGYKPDGSVDWVLFSGCLIEEACQTFGTVAGYEAARKFNIGTFDDQYKASFDGLKITPDHDSNEQVGYVIGNAYTEDGSPSVLLVDILIFGAGALKFAKRNNGAISIGHRANIISNMYNKVIYSSSEPDHIALVETPGVPRARLNGIELLAI